MPHKVGSELADPAGAGSTPAELVVDSTVAAVESSESTPPAAGPSRDESAIGRHPWAWRKIWNEPTARMLGWREFRRYHAELVRTMDPSDAKTRRINVYRPSTWLPSDTPSLELHEYRNREGLRYMAISDNDLAKVEKHLVDSGLTTVAKVFALRQRLAVLDKPLKYVSTEASEGTFVALSDESFSDRVKQLVQRNRDNIGKRDSRSPSPDMKEPPVSLDTGAQVVEASETTHKQATDRSEEQAPVRELVKWGAVVDACDRFTAHHRAMNRRESSAVQDHLPLTPAKLLESVSAPALGASVFRHTSAEGVSDVYVDRGLVLAQVRDLKQRCGFKVGVPGGFAFPPLPWARRTSLEGATPFRARSVAHVQRAWTRLRGPPSPPAPASESPASGTKRAADAAATLPTPAPSAQTTPVPPSVESTPEPPPAKKARTSGTGTAQAKASSATTSSSKRVEPPVMSGETKRAFRDIVDEAKALGMTHFELETLRLAFAHASQHGGAAFLSIDIEMWERNKDLLLEFGWSSLEFVKSDESGEVEARRDTQHVVVRENLKKRNGKYSPDNRDNFGYGTSVRLAQPAIYRTLAALVSTLSAHQHLFVIFHDPRADLRALDQLGFDTARDWQTDLRQLGAAADDSTLEEGGKVWVVDTQRLFSAWLNRRSQIGLEKACAEVKVPTKREHLHNAANDAHYTLNLFERLMNRKRTPVPHSPLVLELDARAKAEAERKRKQAIVKDKRAAEQKEQQALKR